MPSVALAQARLVEAGATDLAVDGIFGDLTRAAVIKFQLEVGVPDTGEVDPTTWAALCYQMPITVVDAIDAGDLAVLRASERYLNDGHSNVVVNYGMSRGTHDFIQHMVASHAPSSVALLRLHGHGTPGTVGVSTGQDEMRDGSIAAGHFVVPQAVAMYTLLGRILKPYGSIELHSCQTASRRAGRYLLAGLARACRVPVTAGLHDQFAGGAASSRFEGPVVTCFPDGTHDIKGWAARVFNRSQW